MPPIIHIVETESTNSSLKELVTQEKLEEGTILVTNFQSAGRGQRGNTWESAKGKNLTFSMVLYPTSIAVHEQFILSQVVSLGIKKALDKYTEGITIKWPNDIYWNEKKICGILIENALSENGFLHSIAGIGLNINQKKFESDAPNPISLSQITNQEYSLNIILEEVRDYILAFYKEADLLGNYKTIQYFYAKSLFRKEGFHRYSDGEQEFEAKIVEVQPDGHLILETEDSEIRKFAFKEVKYIL